MKNIDSWNEIFPEVKLRESDLTNPTQNFLIRTLVAYFRPFGINVDLPNGIRIDTPDNVKAKRLYLAKLTRLTTRILRITDNSYIFTYFDLIKPTPKKTMRVLDILLNYLFYFNMYKNEVFDSTCELIEVRAVLERTNQETRAKMEEKRNHIEMIRKKITSLNNVQIPNARKRLHKLKTLRNKKKALLIQLEFTLNERHTILSELKAEGRMLKKQSVSDVEANELKKHIASLEEQLKHRMERIFNMESILKQRKDTMKTVTELTKTMDKIIERLPLDVNFRIFKERNKKIQEKMTLCNELENKRYSIQKGIKFDEKAARTLNGRISTAKLKSEEEIKYRNKLIEEKENLIQSKKRAKDEINEVMKCLECETCEQQDVMSYIQEHADILFQK
ncbi:spindle assembly checkpoint component MAD1 isoform X2 [Teleopsis dalmanni]|nr:spindle assembly checkpoint component MAD1 isoform X2 [Teleopsis dalmanni]